MDARKCDRCGKFYDIEKVKAYESKFFDKVYEVNSHMQLSENVVEKFDLCPDCRKAFEEFVKGGK